MKSFIYKKWDGTQHPFSLKRKDVIDKFMENIMKGMSPNMSISQMMWNGFPLEGMNFRVMGLNEMIDELQQMKNDLFSKYSLEKIFDDPMNDLKSLLEDEAETRIESGSEKPPAYDELPPGLLEKFNELQDFDFQNWESREVFDNWIERQGDILDLFEFYSEYSNKFIGDEYLNFDEALDIMKQLQAIDELKKQMLSGKITSIDINKLNELLGDDAERSFNILLQIPRAISDEGLVTYDKGRFEMTPRGMRALGEKAFGNIYHHEKRDRQGGHHGNAPQSGEIEPDSSRPYEYGDRFDLDITRTVLQAVSQRPGSGKQVNLSPDDFYVREREKRITSTTVVLLDLSWSMSVDGRFESAKKVALALDFYIRTRFPKDKIHIVGFSTVARELRGNQLSLATWDAEQPFTNLQAGYRLALKLVKRSGNRNNRVIVITDGQPTAYYIGDRLYVEMPSRMFALSPNASRATLAEIRRVTAEGLNIETFMLDNNPVLVEFTRQITKINRGRAVMCMPDELGRLILVEEIKRRGGRI